MNIDSSDEDDEGYVGEVQPSAISIPTSLCKRRRRSTSDASANTPLPSRKRIQTHGGETVIKIVSATYGPAEGQLLLTGESSSEAAARLPYTRDVAPFLRALAIIWQGYGAAKSETEQASHMTGGDSASNDSEMDLGKLATRKVYSNMSLGDSDSTGSEMDLVRLANRKVNFMPIMDGKSMNAIFGDPCPGTSKRLRVHYVVYESMDDATSKASAASEVHRVSFAEHERVVLRRRVTYYQDDFMLQHAITAAVQKLENATLNDVVQGEDEALTKARRMGRAQSIAEFAETLGSASKLTPNTLKPSGSRGYLPPTEAIPESFASPGLPPRPSRKWRLRSATSEIALPIILPFLEVRERVQCQLVCKVWGFVVRNWGVAQKVDVNDPAFPNFTRAFLRGILAHSHHSLLSLNLNNFHEVSQDDLHPALPHLRKLRSLDISRCHQLDDSTLHLIASNLGDSLEVLYLKGLRKVTDKGLISVCRSCQKLQVLELSNIPITDESGVCIGENLTRLRALYMRDNYLLTNKSIDVITEKCTKLAQLTLWGCIKLRHLSFEQPDQNVACGNLVLLNLWGCLSLVDEAANALAPMKNLRSLIASECHRLTDEFLFGLAQNVPQLNHLYLRYCKKITDSGVNAIASNMQSLYSLDLSFCTRLTSASLLNLLELRHEMLVELRLQSCTQLDIVAQRERRSTNLQRAGGDGQAGRAILSVLRSHAINSSLSMLDLRNCEGLASATDGFSNDEPFVQGMTALRFEQKLPGLFIRPTGWNQAVQQRLVEQILSIPATTGEK